MARSKKKTNKGGITLTETEKWEQRAANCSLRRVNKVEVNADREVLIGKRENSNVWGSSKDGKRFYRDPALLRK